MFGDQRPRQLFAPLTEFFDPFFGHRRKIGGIAMSILAGHNHLGRESEVGVILPQEGHHKSLYLPRRL